MRGNITRPRKNSWRLKFDVGRTASGERRIRYVTVNGTRKDADFACGIVGGRQARRASSQRGGQRRAPKTRRPGGY